MEDYIDKFERFETTQIYDFNVGSGGLGDYIKFFMFLLTQCIRTNTRLFLKINNLEIEKFIKLRHSNMYIREHEIKNCKTVKVVKPHELYSTVSFNFSMRVDDVFYFTDEILINRNKLLQCDKPYISIHLRLGDKFLETEKRFIACKDDTRLFSEEKIQTFIEENSHLNIFFCCDNNAFKLRLKEKYKHLLITNCDIGHTSLSNTSQKQILDSVTELYILSMSEQIACGSHSGFSIIASKFNDIPIVKLYECL